MSNTCLTDALTPGVALRLYSQTPFDELGNFYYQGDPHKPGEALTAIGGRIERHLARHFADFKFAVTTQTFAGGRKITANILDAPSDLTARAAQNAVIEAVRDQMERFGFTHSNILQDYHSCAFFCEARIGQSYWSTLARRRGAKNPVVSRMSLAKFKKGFRAGHAVKLVDAPQGHRSLGTTRRVIKVRSGDIILEGGSYLNFPRAGAFACDGRLVRIAIGPAYDPDAHLLYEWFAPDSG
ncbi:hypothetical protein SAMN05518849_11851 [Sphingobium sp. AP50]|uniref:hypothetical protein n=1 Tax=Sphingobium sp. AP50 TaxID=1884369 RepID=UPI0008B41C9C|nr:hypothetical protein [Sphingobium sp. AP50]SEJ91939.1 hypothetical protein SAMN05518849_11851 [Sphingobium sp. AP50]